jgi:arginine deiminase
VQVREGYALQPLHNLFFIRDAAVAIFDQVMISRMANQIRERESLIMEAVLAHHPAFDTWVFHPRKEKGPDPLATIEGGDILVARDDVLIIGQSARTSTQGIDGLIEHFKAAPGLWHIIVQELPYEPESFIHLDMVFTLLDVDACMVYKPLILDSNRYLTLHIRIDHGKVTLRETRNIPAALAKLGMPLKTICCGGDKDTYIQDREQWHSGANFFCVGPGKIMGYGRNVYTLEELDRNGFSIVPAAVIEDRAFDVASYPKIVLTIEGAELARGGGWVPLYDHAP